MFREEFDVIPCVRPEDRSCPVVIDGNNIAILSWCLKELFCFVYHELMKLKTNERDLEKEGTVVIVNNITFIHFKILDFLYLYFQ